jgi:predicted ATPase/DNA-binding CsgD family transcriptional regulator
MLLVLDNFEHLLDGADVVGKILEAAPRIKILVTSREALKLRLEWIRMVTGMSFPVTNGHHQEGVVGNGYSAVQLLVERARRIQPNFSVEDNLACVIRICQLVGGMPLGIELAVAWLRTLSCGEIADEIQRNADILTAQMRDIPERHQSIRVVFNSSWEMLTADEQSAFMRLSVFRGTPTRQAIQSVTGASLQTLSGLADKALILPYENGRYQIHELLRQYAYEKLEASDEHQTTHDAHSQYFLRFLQEREPDLQGRRQVEALEAITLDFENVRVAWLWGLERLDYERIGGAVEPLCKYLHLRSRWKHDSPIVAQAQARFAPQADEAPHPVWGKILSRNHGNVDDSIAQLELSLSIAQAHEDNAEIGLTLHLMGFAYSNQYDQEEAIRYHESSMFYLEAAGDDYHLAAAYGSAAEAYRILGEYEIASTYNRIGYELRCELGDLDGQVFALGELSHEMFMAGNLGEAERLRQEALTLARQIGRIWSISGQAWELSLFHLFGTHGDLAATRQLIDETSKYSDAWYSGFSAGIALITSLFAGVQEDYDEAREKGEQAIKLATRDAWGAVFGWGVLVAATGQGDYATVREHTENLLDLVAGLQIRPLMFVGVAFSSILAAYHDQDPRRATELLALVMTHPHSMRGWLKIWPFIDRLQVHLEAELGSQAYQVAWERGRALDVETVVQELINVLGDDETSVSDAETRIPAQILQANAALLEPLSERELEVLFKIAEGCANREIAAQLFIGLSTVKKHITHIYGKLAVDSRTQALLKAQELGLI